MPLRRKCRGEQNHVVQVVRDYAVGDLLDNGSI